MLFNLTLEYKFASLLIYNSLQKTETRELQESTPFTTHFICIIILFLPDYYSKLIDTNLQLSLFIIIYLSE